MSSVDLSLLTLPDVIETLDFEAILADCKSYLISIYPDIEPMLALESEPALKILQTMAYRELLLRARYNDEARAVLLAFSTGSDLDHIGITYFNGEQRLVITAADLTVNLPIAEELESDSNYRQRLILKPESYSVAGPTGAYQFHALSASGQVKSVGVYSPEAGTTAVYILSNIGTGVPTQALLDIVSATLNQETIRPQSEDVLVYPASIVNYAIDIDLTLYQGANEELILAQANTALIKYASDFHILNAEITASAQVSRVHLSGVKKTVVNTPEIICTTGQAPYCTGINIRVAGVEA